MPGKSVVSLYWENKSFPSIHIQPPSVTSPTLVLGHMATPTPITDKGK